MSLFEPDYKFDVITQITPQQLKAMKIKAVALDVDNTLAEHNHPVPAQGVREWLEQVKAQGIKLLIVSNNKKQRVQPFAQELGLDFVTRAAKPLPVGFWKCARRLSISCREIAVIGDQIFTDILGANLCGAKAVLVSPFAEESGWSFRVRRRFEKKILSKYNKKQSS